MLSICTTVKNRSIVKAKDHTLELLPLFLKSINKITGGVELIISDWGSTDVPIQDTLEKYITKVPYKVIDMGDKKFSRNQGVNAAYENSSGENILFIDADIGVKDKAIKNGVKKLNNGKIIFPIVFAFTELDSRKGLWCKEDFKTVMVTRKGFEKIGPWEEDDTKGKKLFRHCRGSFVGINIIREQNKGFTHHWHPETDKNIWTRRR